jgi:hypothetical protein
MKKAEDTLNAAEAMMLAQIESVDQAKRQKDMLTKLVRDNRLMAEKLLEREKASRRQERIDGARTAFADHLFEAQRDLDGLRLDVVTPDFAGAIKGLKTLTSIDDKIATALANGKIAVDRQAKDVRAKLAWINENASDHRALLADLQQLVAKPFDDFRLAVASRIDAHKKAEELRLEEQRERIRKEELAKIEQERAEAEEASKVVVAEPVELIVDAEPSTVVAVHSVTRSASVDAPFDVFATSERRPTPATNKTIKLGDINARIAPLSITAEGLASIGFHPVGTERAAKLYAESELLAIYRGLYSVITNAANELKKVA